VSKPDLVTFLTARYGELDADVNLAQRAAGGRLRWAAYVLADLAAKRLLLKLHRPHRDYPTMGCDTDNGIDSCGCTGGGPESEWPCETVKIMVAPFAQHPDYDPAWVIE
jgi:hypothetical protein